VLYTLLVDIVQAEGWTYVSFDQLRFPRVNAIIECLSSGGRACIEQRYGEAGVCRSRGILRGGDGSIAFSL